MRNFKFLAVLLCVLALTNTVNAYASTKIEYPLPNLTSEQIEKLNQLNPDWEKHFHNDSPYKGKPINFIDSLKPIKTETIDESDGSTKIYIYYDVKLKDTEEVRNLTKGKFKTNSGTSTYLTGPDPGQGAVRLVIDIDKLNGLVPFDEAKNQLKSQLMSLFWSKVAEYSGKIFGSGAPVWELLTTIIQHGFDTGEYKCASITAYTRERFVHKYAEIYNGSSWERYISSCQQEIYWLEVVDEYGPDGNYKGNTHIDYLPDKYQPIEWWSNLNFNNNTELCNMAIYRYTYNLGMYYDSNGPSETSTNWKTTPPFTYQ